jgi:hypothetical protein
MLFTVLQISCHQARFGKELYSVSSLHDITVSYDLKQQPLQRIQNPEQERARHIQKTSDSSEKYMYLRKIAI